MKKSESKPPAPTKRKKRTAPKLEWSDERSVNVKLTDEDQLRRLLGTETKEMGDGLFSAALHALGVEGKKHCELMAAMGEEMKPRDAVEAMLCSQQVATHVAMMHLSGKVMDAQSPQLREGYERSMTRLSRTFLAQVDALKKYRAKAQQVVRVERVDARRRPGDCRQCRDRGGGAMKKNDANPMQAAQAAPRCTARSKRTGLRCRNPAVSGWRVCRMHGAGGGHRAGPTHPQWKHGGRSREAVTLRKLVVALGHLGLDSK